MRVATWALVAALVAVWCAPLARADEYRIGEGDGLAVQVYEEPTLSGEVVVSNECTVTLGLIGRVAVCGKTTDEVAAEVTSRYSGDFLVDPTVAVKVASYRSQRVDVLGEVARPGPQFLQGPTTLIEVVSLAGGPRSENVVVVDLLRADGSSQRYDLTELGGGEGVYVTRGDKVFLRPGEVVYVEGQIKRPGTVTLSEGLTVTQALALAGGASEYANLRQVLVRRADGTKSRVNILRINRGIDEDPVLGPDDRLIVPGGGAF
jgi:polysaccharide export outer membrane protein